MITFLALYRGRTIKDAKLISVSTNPALVRYATSQILDEANLHEPPVNDAILNAVNSGQRQALRLIVEAGDET